MVNCCVAGCKSRTERKCENITLHTFPKDETLRKVWIAATGRQNWQPTQYTRMCSLHFKADCFQKKQLKIYLIKYSIPTLSIHAPSSGEFHPHVSKEDPPILKCASKSSLEYENIAGFVVKRLKTQIKCQNCLSLLTAEDKNENTLQFKKDKGGLHYPSKSVIKLCEIAERTHRENKISSKTDHMHHLLQICLKRSLGLNLFSNDQHAPSEQHFSLLIKATCKKYLNVRIHYSTKSIVNKEEYVRNMYNKLTLFKGQ